MVEPGLQRIERSPLYEVVAERLREFIASENLEPGVRPGPGSYLLRPPDDFVSTRASEVAKAEVDHPMIWEVREGVEVQATRLAARRRTDADLVATPRVH